MKTKVFIVAALMVACVFAAAVYADACLSALDLDGGRFYQ